MFHGRTHRLPERQSFPCICGDVPIWSSRKEETLMTFSRVYGDVPHYTLSNRCHRYLFPVYMGMFLCMQLFITSLIVFSPCKRGCSYGRKGRKMYIDTFPRVYGDIPVGTASDGSQTFFSLRMRGCSFIPVFDPHTHVPFPRVSGDVPKEKRRTGHDRSFSPCKRGCSFRVNL